MGCWRQKVVKGQHRLPSIGLENFPKILSRAWGCVECTVLLVAMIPESPPQGVVQGYKLYSSSAGCNDDRIHSSWSECTALLQTAELFIAFLLYKVLRPLK